jgi:hypothetical protein
MGKQEQSFEPSFAMMLGLMKVSQPITIFVSIIDSTRLALLSIEILVDVSMREHVQKLFTQEERELFFTSC